MTHKILVVDDDDDARQTLLCVLSPVADVVAAASGAEALRMLEVERPELMLLDVGMPGMGGLDVLESGLKLAPRLVVVMLTGQCDIAVAKAALERGARAYITKPVDPRRLREEIQDILGLNSQADDAEHRMPWRVIVP
jgi:DNA-binding NtrC family response regulator